MNPTEHFHRALRTSAAAIADADTELPDVLDRFG